MDTVSTFSIGPSVFNLAYAWGRPEVQAAIRCTPEDFVVDEQLSFIPTGSGEHLLVQIEKRNTNTDWVIRQLAKLLSLPKVDIGYAGLKDRHALTRQWFSLRLPRDRESPLQQLEAPDIRIVETRRHSRKLRPGALKANRFRISLRDIAVVPEALQARLQVIAKEGVPNYFGEQRFGIENRNLDWAVALFKGRRVKNRHQRGLYFSAARSMLFNAVLSQRVEAGTWNKAQPGDVFILDGRRNVFYQDDVDDTVVERITDQAIHPTGPLWGRGPLPASIVEWERQVLEPLSDWCAGLEAAGLESARRSLRCPVKNFTWEWMDQQLILQFDLAAGSYATSVLRELVAYRDDSRRESRPSLHQSRG
ncbi:MAG: tRNA pseudouridine(13) synthase TruD [Gammaproteobacteria bacterium]|nr:tRNA pseudouridine(13) synthase TruD [Gammaproteobacteria bacterium]